MERSPEESPFATTESTVGAAARAASEEFIGRWDRLISRTNWEKGRILSQWRAALVAAGADVHDYGDDAWSRLVGGVTPQHVGRLRRTFDRFFAEHEKYRSLYWSHFAAALDWNDAELWLSGAAESRWSISEMRRMRWETLGRANEAEPLEAEAAVADTDEDAAMDDGTAAAERAPREFTGDDGPSYGETDFGDEAAAAETTNSAAAAAPFDATTPERPFENLPAVPADVREAFEQFKLAILHHKLQGWNETTSEAVVAHLRALERLASAPA